MRCNRVEPKTLAIVAALLLAGIASARSSSAQAPSQRAAGVRLRGTLVLSDVAVCQHTRIIWVHKVPATNKIEGIGIEVGEGGVVLNPRAAPDSLGRFVVIVPDSYMPGDRRVFLSLTCFAGGLRSREFILQNKATRVAVVVVPPGVRAMELDSVTALGH